jgi:uncharacterized protein YhhL (DUF1145 family)
MSAPKLLLLGVWLLCLFAVVGGGGGWFLSLSRTVFWGMIAVHGIECLVFLGRLRRAPGPLAGQLARTLLFGFLHVRELPTGS